MTEATEDEIALRDIVGARSLLALVEDINVTESERGVRRPIGVALTPAG